MYFLKVEGTTKISHFLQIRDDEFGLREYFKLSEAKNVIPRLKEKYNFKISVEELLSLIEKSPFSKIVRFE